MATDRELFDGVAAIAKRERPKFKIAFKDESWSQRLIGFLVRIYCPNYMTSYTTVVGDTVYFPNRKYIESGEAWKILAHELVHLIDRKLNPFWMPLSYPAPQWLALLSLASLGAFWNSWWLLALGFLAALAPWASPWRTRWELRGYTMTMAVNFWRFGGILSETKRWIVNGPLTGWGYYRMCWSKTKARKMVEDAADRIADGSVLLEPYPNTYLMVYNLLKTLNAMR